MANFELLNTEYGEENVVKVPRGARICRGPHVYDPQIVNNKAVGYRAVPYEHQNFPKMLYHPEYGKEPKPDIKKFSAGCSTPEQYQAALVAFNEAEQKWMRKNRTKMVANEKEEARLIKKGWSATIPTWPNSEEKFDLNSEEI